jgi:hypothetical protein
VAGCSYSRYALYPWEECLGTVTCTLVWASLGMEHPRTIQPSFSREALGLSPAGSQEASFPEQQRSNPRSLVLEGAHTLVLGWVFNVPRLSRAGGVSTNNSALT